MISISLNSKAVVRRYFAKYIPRKNSESSQESTCANKNHIYKICN